MVLACDDGSGKAWDRRRDELDRAAGEALCRSRESVDAGSQAEDPTPHGCDAVSSGHLHRASRVSEGTRYRECHTNSGDRQSALVQSDDRRAERHGRACNCRLFGSRLQCELGGLRRSV
jgi:hypothetical protein